MAVLRAAKLRSLIRSATGHDIGPDIGNQGRVVEGRAYRLADAIRDLGPSLHWALQPRSGPTPAGLTLFADPLVAPVLARRAAAFDFDIEVVAIVVQGAEFHIQSVPAEPPPPVPELSGELWQAAAVIADAGARVVDDHGRLVAEVLGLEVGRLTMDGSRPRLHVGVGEADRDLQDHVHGHLDDGATLSRAVATVATYRVQPAHPLNRLARPRWLRSILIDNPRLLGLSALDALAPLRPSSTLLDTEPSAAYSPSDQVVVVCSVGVDLDLLPEAADYRLRTNPEASLIVVVPERDRALTAARLLDLLPRTTVRSIDVPWESLAS